MRPDPSLGVFGRLPLGWTASPRRRRLTFVALLFPGAVMAVAGAQILVSPPWLAAGVGWLAVAIALRWASEPRFAALEGRAEEARPRDKLEARPSTTNRNRRRPRHEP